MSAPGRPKREHPSARREFPVSEPGRPKRERTSARREFPVSAPGHPKRERTSARREFLISAASLTRSALLVRYNHRERRVLEGGAWRAGGTVPATLSASPLSPIP